MSIFDGLTQPQAVLVAGLIGAFGAVAASVITNFFGHFFARRSESKMKYNDLRREAYAKVSATVLEMWDLCDDEGYVSVSETIPDKSRAKFREVFSNASFLAKSDAVDKALDELFWAVATLWTSGKEWDLVNRRTYEALNNFERQARREIGLPDLPYTKTYAEYKRDFDNARLEAEKSTGESDAA